ncbi:FxsA family protein [Roseobacter sinensis]|uniref:FxsA family protein n=1 Tax=Roseobacter sinensis TaxID=2931391 RepID=A0ABT3B8V1_9RHOB|nr:FxsA family protein [Roseobacter sp. WL0113]MCV3270004.1 FxsA family protein [Roseobacter sp. WL0113]
MWLFIAFLAVPLIEIALFIQIGGAIGLGWTLVTVVLTAIAGTWLVRNQGLLAMSELKSSFSDLRDPTEPLVHGAMILFSGALLLTPGFFTDAIGFLLLIPAVRIAVFKAVRARVTVQTFQSGPPPRRPHPRDDIIDGDYTEVPPERDRIRRPSKWTDH